MTFDMSEVTARMNRHKKAGKLIRWEGNVPVPIYREPYTKEQINQLINACVATPYIGETDPETGELLFEERFMGMTNMEVAMMRQAEAAAAGSTKSFEMILDRLLGKPKQQVESVGLKMDYQQYLDFLAKEENQEARENVEIEVNSEPIDVYAPDEEEDEHEPYSVISDL